MWSERSETELGAAIDRFLYRKPIQRNRNIFVLPILASARDLRYRGRIRNEREQGGVFAIPYAKRIKDFFLRKGGYHAIEKQKFFSVQSEASTTN